MFEGLRDGAPGAQYTQASPTAAPAPSVPSAQAPAQMQAQTQVPTQSVNPAQPASGTPTSDSPAGTPTNLTEAEQIEQNIVASFITKINDLLFDEPISLQNLKKNPDYPSYRHYFLRFLREDQITTADEENMLKALPAALDQLGSREIFQRIVSNPQSKQILAIITGHDSTNWQDVVAADIDKLLELPKRKATDYRTPIGFAEFRRRFLSEIREQSTPNQFDQYIKSMDNLEEHLYGIRYSYYRQFEKMRDEALSLNQSATASLSVETAPTVERTYDPSANPSVRQPGIESLSALTPLMPSSRLTPVSDEHRDQLLAHAIIEGDPWRQGGQEYTLNVPSLASAGLVPKYQLNLENQAFYLSNLFKLTTDHLAVIAYVPIAGQVKVRSFYRDKITALWRYLPDYTREINGEGIDAFGIGYHERSTILPTFIQAACAEIERNRGLLDLSNTNPDFLFAGTAPAYNSRQEYRDNYVKHTLRGDFYTEVEPYAMNTGAPNIIQPGRRKGAPQLLSISQEAAPNFNQPQVHFSAYSTFAGQVMGEGFPSSDNQATWLFMSDYRGRNWVANIEPASPLTTTGCRKDWLLLTDLTTPLYESSHLADGYGDPTDTRGGNYLSMWNNYLSKTPLHQQYLALLKRRG